MGLAALCHRGADTFPRGKQLWFSTGQKTVAGQKSGSSGLFRGSLPGEIFVCLEEILQVELGLMIQIITYLIPQMYRGLFLCLPGIPLDQIFWSCFPVALSLPGD